MRVVGNSMTGVLAHDDVVIVVRYSRLVRPRLGDLVVGTAPGDGWTCNGVAQTQAPLFVKHLAAGPGQIFALPDPTPGGRGSRLPKRLDAGEYAVVGRIPSSADSRTWGVVERSLLLGRVLLRTHPASHRT